eukprot:8735486-Ditylum_brightwellii.AAC.1
MERLSSSMSDVLHVTSTWFLDNLANEVRRTCQHYIGIDQDDDTRIDDCFVTKEWQQEVIENI